MARFFAAVALLHGSALFAANPIQIENARPGDPTWVLRNEATNGEIEGYASATSVNRGEQISLFVSTTHPSYQLMIYRMGWYGGAGARRMLGPVSVTGRRQPMPTPDPVTGLIECNWTDPYILPIPRSSDPTEWASGFYLAKLITPNNRQKFILFVVRDDSRGSNHYFQSSVTTNQAYNNWGGKSLYDFNSTNAQPARKVSFNRPYTEGAGGGQFIWRWEYSMVRFMEREGYDVTYCTNIDTARRGELLLNHRSFLSVGHDEYWSDEMRDTVEHAIDQGVHIGFFSANTCYWQIRMEPSVISGQADRTMVGYKQVALQQDPYALDGDPTNDQYITTKWRLPPVSRSEDRLMGVMYVYDPVKNGDIVIDDITSAPWVFESTGLTTGSRLVAMLGYEVDAIGPGTPVNTIRLGHSPFLNTKVTPNRTEYSDMTVYTAPGGAFVFATGSIQWAWALDDFNTSSSNVPVSEPAQQITRNILRKFAGTSSNYDCKYTLNPPSATLAQSGGTGSISVSAAHGCTWTANSSDQWLTVTSPTSGDGNGVVTYEYEANQGIARTATIGIGDQTFNATQALGCTYSISPTSASLAAAGGNGSIAVTPSSATCSWTASTTDNWIAITSGTSGTGTGAVSFTVSPNAGVSRTGTITAANLEFTVGQANGCTYTVGPTTASHAISGGTGSISVTTDASCDWSATSDAEWITITSPAQDNGDGSISYVVAANDGIPRSGSLYVAGVRVDVDQAGIPCDYSISPASGAIGAAGGTLSVNVFAFNGCGWSTESELTWVTVTPPSGSGNGVATITVSPNSLTQGRTGTVDIAGQTYSISQNASGASFMQLIATGNPPSSASLSWTAMVGAAVYEITRSTGNAAFVSLGTTQGTSFVDSGLAPQTTYLYRIHAIAASKESIAWSNAEPASTFAFTDDPIISGVTVVKAVHFQELRAAVNSMRAAVGLPAAAFSADVARGLTIRANHILELRAALDAAYRALYAGPYPYADPNVGVGRTIRAAHITELRQAVR